MRIDANGLTFACLEWGEAGAPLALCLHGYPDTAHTWRHLGPALADAGWHVVAPFMRGYGPTDLAPDDEYGLRALAADAVALKAALGGDDRAVLIGHDWGATTASLAAPHFARTVTLAVPPTKILVSAPPGLLARQLRLSWYMGFQQIPGLSERALTKLVPRLWATWSPGYDATEDLAHLEDAWRGPGRRRAALRYYRALRQLRPKDLRAGSPPTLYLHGADDGCMFAAYAERAGGTVIPGTGHFLHLEQPERVNALIADYVGRRASISG